MAIERLKHFVEKLLNPAVAEKNKERQAEATAGELVLLSTLAGETFVAKNDEFLPVLCKRMLHARDSDSYQHGWSTDASGQHVTLTHVLQNYRDRNSILESGHGQNSEQLISFSNLYLTADHLTEGLKIETDGRECLVLIFPDLHRSINRVEFAKLLNERGFPVQAGQISQLFLLVGPDQLGHQFQFSVQEGVEKVHYFFTYLPVRYDTDSRELWYFICTKLKPKVKNTGKVALENTPNLGVLIPQAFIGKA